EEVRLMPSMSSSATVVDDPVEAEGSVAAAAVFEVTGLDVFYGAFRAVRDVRFTIEPNQITAFIGPSGCGKTTVLRCLNRMNDLIESARVQGDVRYRGVDLYAVGVDAVEVRRRIGMVFQK